MDRSIVYPGSIPLDTDLLNTNRNAMIAIGVLAQATLGTTTVVDGLNITATVPASMSVTAGPGSITQLSNVDQNAYGSLAADTSDGLLKMGLNLQSTGIPLIAPTTSGQSISYLIEAAFEETDTDLTVLPYYNAANPASPYLGPNNTGAPQATQRIQRVQLQAKGGAPATTGAQLTPSVDAGWVGLAVVNVAYGQTQIIAAGINQLATSPALQYKLPSLRPGFAAISSFTSSGAFTVPIAVTQVRVTVIGGGGAGGTHTTIPSGGGGGGGHAIATITGLTPGSQVPVTVGAGGIALTGGPTGPGGTGGTSSFGTYVSATGGSGGGGGSVVTTAAGGSGGSAVGGNVNVSGSCGTDSIIPAARGGDGGGPGAGRGTTGLIQGIAGLGYGGGGGGGGSSSTSGTGTGAPGGNGAGGLVIVEY